MSQKNIELIISVVLFALAFIPGCCRQYTSGDLLRDKITVIVHDTTITDKDKIFEIESQLEIYKWLKR